MNGGKNQIKYLQTHFNGSHLLKC